jgi:hypothetical protein
MHHRIPILHLIPMQTTNHPLVMPPILTNHTPLVNSPYRPLALHVNVGPQLYIFLTPFDHAQVGHFPLPTLLVLTVGHDQTPQPTPIFSIDFQFPTKVFCHACGCHITNRRLIHYQHSYQTFNSYNPNPCDHHGSIPSLVLTPPIIAWTWVSS